MDISVKTIAKMNEKMRHIPPNRKGNIRSNLKK